MYKYIISLDISGNFNEGKGTSGVCLFSIEENRIIDVFTISAFYSECAEQYWSEHIDMLNKYKIKYGDELCVRCEDFLLYQHKANNQIQSRFETPQLIGIIKYWCYITNTKLFIRSASTVKNRWTDDILIKKGYIAKESNSLVPLGCDKHKLTCHEVDAIRHAVACYYFDLGDNI